MESSERTVIEQLVDRLVSSYPDVPPEKVATVVAHEHAEFDGRPVRDFIPLFVERRARRELASSVA
ncbi:three-helix bundle dimerization domain-containing protein [Mycobacterium sp. NPDC006124]|uniref:three-helix bundle dimerization domain-containing protein n=1 Tax=Mycobacterium sp. NPDC006124 TaxID=3156729 RepID=UPI0033ACC099